MSVSRWCIGYPVTCSHIYFLLTDTLLCTLSYVRLTLETRVIRRVNRGNHNWQLVGTVVVLPCPLRHMQTGKAKAIKRNSYCYR